MMWKAQIAVFGSNTSYYIDLRSIIWKCCAKDGKMQNFAIYRTIYLKKSVIQGVEYYLMRIACVKAIF